MARTLAASVSTTFMCFGHHSGMMTNALTIQFFAADATAILLTTSAGSPPRRARELHRLLPASSARVNGLGPELQVSVRTACGSQGQCPLFSSVTSSSLSPRDPSTEPSQGERMLIALLPTRLKLSPQLEAIVPGKLFWYSF